MMMTAPRASSQKDQAMMKKKTRKKSLQS